MKIGIVGTGALIKELLPVLSKMREIEIVVLCGTERSKHIVNELSAEYNIPVGVTDYDEFLKYEMDASYIAIPNYLHYEYAMKAMESGKNVIIEKPVTISYETSAKLRETAVSKGLFLFEAITTMYLPNYLKIKELVKEIGEIKMVQCNFSQYSSRYDSFKAGNLPPVFDPEKGGGALMDLNLYNIYYVVGLFGKPVMSEYYPNVERNIDTSGIFIMDYDEFKAVCIAAKDCSAPAGIIIQGTKGYIMQNSTPNICGEFIFYLNNVIEEKCNLNGDVHRIVAEFKEFDRIISENDTKKCNEMMDLSVLVSEIMDRTVF